MVPPVPAPTSSTRNGRPAGTVAPRQATADAALQAQLRALHLEPLPAQGDSLAAVVRDDLGAWERITRSLNLYRST